MTLASNSENVYFLPNSILNFRKVTKFGGNWLKNKNVTGRKQIGRWKTPPPVLIGLSNVIPLKIKVKSQSFFFGGGGGGEGRKSRNAEQQYVLFKELEAYLGLSLTSSGT